MTIIERARHRWAVLRIRLLGLADLPYHPRHYQPPRQPCPYQTCECALGGQPVCR